MFEFFFFFFSSFPFFYHRMILKLGQLRREKEKKVGGKMAYSKEIPLAEFFFVTWDRFLVFIDQRWLDEKWRVK